jgi:hypothetical protein
MYFIYHDKDTGGFWILINESMNNSSIKAVLVID